MPRTRLFSTRYDPWARPQPVISIEHSIGRSRNPFSLDQHPPRPLIPPYRSRLPHLLPAPQNAPHQLARVPHRARSRQLHALPRQRGQADGPDADRPSRLPHDFTDDPGQFPAREVWIRFVEARRQVQVGRLSLDAGVGFFKGYAEAFNQRLIAAQLLMDVEPFAA